MLSVLNFRKKIERGAETGSLLEEKEKVSCRWNGREEEELPVSSILGTWQISIATAARMDVR